MTEWMAYGYAIFQFGYLAVGLVIGVPAWYHILKGSRSG